MKQKITWTEISAVLNNSGRGLCDFCGTDGIGLTHKRRTAKQNIRKLKKILKQNLKQFNMKIINKPSKYSFCVMLYADLDNSDGYDVIGTYVTKSNKPISSIAYCGICGDVNTLYFNSSNSKILYIEANK